MAQTSAVSLPTRRDNVSLKTNLECSYRISIAHSRPAKRENDSVLTTKRLKSSGNSLIRIFPRDTAFLRRRKKMDTGEKNIIRLYFSPKPESLIVIVRTCISLEKRNSVEIFSGKRCYLGLGWAALGNSGAFLRLEVLALAP